MFASKKQREDRFQQSRTFKTRSTPHMIATIEDNRGNKGNGMSHYEGDDSVGSFFNRFFGGTSLYKSFIDSVKPLPINKSGDIRPPFQCAEPSAYVSYLVKHLENKIPIYRDALTSLHFTNISYQDSSDQEEPCPVCQQWVNLGSHTVKPIIFSTDIPDAPNPPVPITDSEDDEVVLSPSRYKDRRAKKRLKAKVAKANKQAPPSRI